MMARSAGQGQGYLFNWDFTESLYDKVANSPAYLSAKSTYSAPQRTSEGVVFNKPTQMIGFDDIITDGFAGLTIEYDVATCEFAGNADYHIRHLCLPRSDATTTYVLSPLVYRAGQGWASYSYNESSGWARTWSDAWPGLSGTTAAVVNVMSGKTVKMEIASDANTVNLYIGDDFIGTHTGRYYDARCGRITFGGFYTKDQTKGDQCYNLTLSGLRIYRNNL